MIRIVEDAFLYSVADRDHFETIDRYQPDTDHFVDPVRRWLPAGWQTVRTNIWHHCAPPEARIPAQGWKIHVSATLHNATPVLWTAARVLAAEQVPFKHAVDRTMLYFLNFKRWPRGGSGKFITVYPRDTEQCGSLLEQLHDALAGYVGPYILSDRRYRDSKVVFYRYGGLLPTRLIEASGRKRLVIEAPDGTLVDDERTPAFTLPPGVEDPFCPPAPVAEERPLLKGGRYEITSAITFSNSGGVYVARDGSTGREVLIKEARPHTNLSMHGTEAVGLLKKEHRLLTAVSDTGIAPQPIDFFQEWEHCYLVEEFLDGTALRFYMAARTIVLRVVPTRELCAAFYDNFRAVFARVAEMLAVLHEREIVFGDVSLFNVFVLDRDGADLRLIDFEGGHQQRIDVPTLIFTPGFATRELVEEGVAQPADDLFGLGGLMLAALHPINTVMGLEPQAYRPFLAAFQRDLALPSSVARLIDDLLALNRGDRPSLDHVIRVLREDGEKGEIGEPSIGAHELDETDVDEVVRETLEYALAHATPDREDRLFPASPLVFETNPLSVAHGACGVAYVLHAVRGSVPARVMDWILARPVTQEQYPPGLYVGSAGIAWVLWELGLHRRAEETLRRSVGHPALEGSPDLYDGMAGWGLACLRFHGATGDGRYLRLARGAGDHLRRTARVEGDEASWPFDGREHCGLGHGAAGVSLFLLYLGLASGAGEYLELGRRGLRYVLARGVRNADDGLTWRIEEGDDPTHTPYWRWGSAGVAGVLMRYAAALDEDQWLQPLRETFLDADRKYSVFPGRHTGLAGIADFWLDADDFGVAPGLARAAAARALAGMLLFRLKRPGGTAFPGDSRDRISCDFATGGAGNALVLHRYLHGGPSPFLLDELLTGKVQRTPRSSLLAVV